MITDRTITYVMIAIAIVIVGGKLILNIDQSEKLNEREVPFSAIVIEEKLLCFQNGGCMQEVKFGGESQSGSYRRFSEPWVTKGQEIEVIKVWDHKTLKETNRRKGIYHYELLSNDS